MPGGDSGDTPMELRKRGLPRAWLAIAVILAILGIGLSVAEDYGISADEIHGIDVLSRNYELVVNGIPIHGVYKYDGTIFNFGAEGVYQFYKHMVAGPELARELDRDITTAFRTRIQVKHVLTFLTSLLAYGGVAVMVGLLCGWRHAWTGPVILFLLPRFFGHSFFNFKDVPFAAIFTLCSLHGAFIVDRALSGRAGNAVDGEVMRGFAIYGLLVSLLTAIRFGGFVLLFYPAAAWLVVKLLSRPPGALPVHRLAGAYLLALGCWFAGTVLMYPVLWSDPLGGVVGMVRTMSDYPWPGTVLFDGEFIRSYRLPASYLPVWLAITTPVLTLAAAACGFTWLLCRWHAMDPLPRVLVIFIFLQAFLLPVTTVVGGATYYDGLRHFMFILPAVAVAAGVALIRVYQAIPHRIVRVAFLALLGLAYTPVVVDMTRLHPYEHTYFNRAFGGLPAADGRFETDYWGLSLREGAEWLQENAPADATVVVGGPLHTVEPFLDRGMRLIPLEDVKSGEAQQLGERFYYIARPRWRLHEEFRRCTTVYAITRQETPLSIVKQCGPVD